MMIFFGCTKEVCQNRNKRDPKWKESEGKMLDVERKAKEILVQTKSLQTYNIAELRVLLTYYQVK